MPKVGVVQYRRSAKQRGCLGGDGESARATVIDPLIIIWRFFLTDEHERHVSAKGRADQ